MHYQEIDYIIVSKLNRVVFKQFYLTNHLSLNHERVKELKY